MKPSPQRRGIRRTALGAAAATGAASLLLIPLAGAASAAVSSVTSVSNPSANTYQATGTTANFQVTVNSPVGPGEVAAILTSGPDSGAGAFGANGAGFSDVSCVVSGTVGSFTASPTSPVCSIPNTLGAGVDQIQIYADKNGNNMIDSNEPSTTVQATFVGAADHVSLSGPSTVAQNTCAVFTANVLDANNRGVISKAFVVKATQSGVNPDPVAFSFCPASPELPSGYQALTDADASATIVRANPTTGASGEPVIFGIRSDSKNPISLQAFVDSVVADNTLTAGEPNATATLAVTNGGQDAATSVTVTPTRTSIIIGDPETGTVTVTNGINPLAGVVVRAAVSGANPAGPANLAPTNNLGQTSFGYTATKAGTDTVTAFVNQTTGGTANRDATEPQGTSTITVSGAPTSSVIDLTAVGSIAGGTTDSTTNATIAENSVIPTTQPTETFNAKVTDPTTGLGKPGVLVRFTTPVQNVSGAGNSADDATLSATEATTDSSGIATVVLTDPNPVSGDAYKLVATIAGTTAADDAFTLFQASSAGINSAPSSTNSTLGSSFPATSGVTTIAPSSVTTLVGTAKTFVTTVNDQYGVAKSGVNTFYQVTGRNPILPVSAIAANKVTDASGKSSFTYTDGQTTASDPSNPATYDTVKVVTDVDGNGVQNPSTEPSATATRFYTLTAPTAAAVEGGFGTPTQQFSGTTAPYNPVTTDDTTTKAVDVTHTISNQTPVQAFFEVRNADNSSALPGETISVSSSGVGSLVGTNNAALSSPQTITVGDNGFATINVLSTKIGLQRLTGTADGQSKTLTITWTNTGSGRYLTLSPSSKSAAVGTPTLFTSHVADLYANPVAGQSVALSLSGPGQFANGTNSTNGTTDTNGDFVANVTELSPGTVTITATATGAQFNAAKDSPNSGDIAGKGTASATLTSSAAPSSSTTTLTANPTSPQVGQFTTATTTVKDASGAVISGQQVRFTVTGATTAASNTLTTNGSGQAAFSFTSNTQGSTDIKLSVIDSSGFEQFAKHVSVTFFSSEPGPPVLSQTSSHGVVILTTRTSRIFEGKTVIYFRRSGITGKVVPAGTAVVNNRGIAQRVLHQTTNQILALYCKLLVNGGISNPYSNTIAFKVL